MNSSLQRIVGQSEIYPFLHEIFEKAPWLRTVADEQRFSDLLNLEDIDEIVAASNLKHPNFRIVHEGEQLSLTQVTTSRILAGNTEHHIAKLEVIYRSLREGKTLVLQRLQTFWPALQAFCDQLEKDIGCASQANAYLTPKNKGGLQVHYDTHDVFILQVSGSKHWKVYKPLRPLPLRMQKEHQDPREVEQWATEETLLVDRILQPGEVLYIPRGFVHVARATDETSLHLTIGLMTVRMVDLLEEAVKLMLETAESMAPLRMTLPLGGAQPKLDPANVEAFKEIVRLLGSKVTIDEVLARISSRAAKDLPTNLQGRLLDMMEVPGLLQQDVYLQSREISPQIECLPKGGISLCYGGNQLELTQQEAGLFDRFPAKGAFLLSSIAPDNHHKKIVDLACQLIRFGLYRICREKDYE